MGTIHVQRVGKAYKRYRHKWHRLIEWLTPGLNMHEQRWVLRDIDFSVEAGEAVAIIGANGAGKSTLLKLITGTTKTTEGCIQVQGRVAALLELGMGFQPDFTGRENVYLAAQLLGLPDDLVCDKMDEIEAFAEIGAYIDEPLRTYSSGMQVRLAFSVATAIRPDILIVDEALSVGDIFFQQKCFERIRSFNMLGTTLLFVTHSMASVYSLCERAILLDHGRMLLDDLPKAVIDLFQAQELAHINARHDLIDRMSPSKSELDTVGSDQITLSPLVGAPAEIGDVLTDYATIQDVRLMCRGRVVNTVISDSDLAVVVTVLFHCFVDDPHVGFQLRDARGEPVFMTNTYCMRRAIGAVGGGERVVVRFAFKAGLAAGTYSLTVGVANGGHGNDSFRQQLARRQNAAVLTILKNFEAIIWGGVYNLDPRLDVARERSVNI